MSFASWSTSRIFRRSDRKRDAKLVLPKDVTVEKNIHYIDDRKKEHLFDIYTPRGKEEFFLPVIVNVHGGGYVYGDKELYQHYCAYMARQGFTVISFNYSLAPKHKFPTQLSEINAMFDWIKGHNERYHLDLNNLFAIGDSAGAQLLSHYVALLYDKEFQTLFPKIPFVEGLDIKAMILNCGMYDLKSVEWFKKSRFSRGLLTDYFGKGNFGKEEIQKKVDVLSHIHENYPPCYLLTSQYDFLREQSEMFDRFLTEKNIEHEFHHHGKEGEKFYDHNFELRMGDKRAVVVDEDEAKFLRKHQKDGYSDLNLDVSSLLNH